MVMQRSQLDKLKYSRSVSPAHTDDDWFLVGVYVGNPDLPAPDVLQVKPYPGRWQEPNHLYGQVQVKDMKTLNDDPNVTTIIFVRKIGPIEFTDDQVFAAYKQDLRETNYMSPPKEPFYSETRQQFMDRDIIGYEETMGAYERILYAACGYI